MLHSNARAFRVGFSLKREDASSVLRREMFERSWGSFLLVVVLVARLVRRRDRDRVVKEGIRSILQK